MCSAVVATILAFSCFSMIGKAANEYEKNLERLTYIDNYGGNISKGLLSTTVSADITGKTGVTKVKIKMELQKLSDGNYSTIETWEQNILLRSVCNTLIPKLVSEDITLFNSLLKGVFPNCVIEEVKEDELKNKIIELCKIRNLLPETKFIDKILQLYSIQTSFVFFPQTHIVF